jgi:hypothetical protein
LQQVRLGLEAEELRGLDEAVEEGGDLGPALGAGTVVILWALPEIVWVGGPPAMLPSRRIGAMRDVELYRTLLGLTPPWTVASVDLDVAGQRRGSDRDRRRAAQRTS